MITIRRLLLFSCLALLGGCATQSTSVVPYSGPTTSEVPCSPPNGGVVTGRHCHYRFEIKTIDVDNNLVQGVVPDEVFNEAEAPVPNSKMKFTFRLRDCPKDQIKVGGIYDFAGQEDSSFVECLPDRKFLDRENQ
jgi:hypothetical protein